MKFTPRGEFPRQRPLLASPLVLLSGEQLGFCGRGRYLLPTPGVILTRVAGPGHSVPRQGLPAQRYPALQALRVQWIEPRCR